MRDWTAEQVAEAAGAARLMLTPPDRGPGAAVRPGPERVVIDSREAGPGALFVGLPGAHVDGGAFAAAALASGAWGVLVAPGHAGPGLWEPSRADDAPDGPAAEPDGPAAEHDAPDGPAAEHDAPDGVVLLAEDPLAALQRLARAWRRGLGARVIGVTGSSGKTSTKDLLFAILSPHLSTAASRVNRNTEIGLPLEILAAPAGTEVLVLEMGMRGKGQIAELAAIAEPDVAVVVNVGTAHLELLGSVEAIAAAKAELIAALPPHGTAVVPSGEPLLEPHLRDDVTTVTFGPGGDIHLIYAQGDQVEIDLAGTPVALEVPFTQAYMRLNLLAAVAAARAVGVIPRGRIDAVISAGRGERRPLPGGITLIDHCYNANPSSMRAALEDLAAVAAPEHRLVAVLGDMLELGPRAQAFHLEIGREAERLDVGLLVTVGPLAAAMATQFSGQAHSLADAAEAAALVPTLLREGDVVLVKGSLSVGLEAVCRALTEAAVA